MPISANNHKLTRLAVRYIVTIGTNVKKNGKFARAQSLEDALNYSIVDTRLDRMIEIADETGLTLDYLVAVIGRCDERTFRALSVNPSRLPRYTKSKESP